MPPIDALVVGAGPAGLAAAIRLRQRLPDATVAVVDKAAAPGFHNLSGAIFEPGVLDELLPDWRDDRSRFAEQVTPVERDELYLLTGRRAARLPAAVVPRAMRHDGDVTLSVSKLTAFLSDRAGRVGVEVHHGFSARSLIVEDGAVRGVRLADAGVDADGRPKDNYLAGEEVRAPITLIADGSRGVLSTQLAELVGDGADGRRDPQTYGLGIKAIVQFPADSPFGTGRVVHTLGYPAEHGLFGGGFLYSMGPRTVAVGLILGLDWPWGDLDPRAEFERFRAHPFVAGLLDGGTTIATGAKTIPSGGFYALGPLAVPGALVAGDAAGFVNEARLKGLHYAMRTGMLAAEAIADARLSGGSELDGVAARYAGGLAQRGVLDELRGARNYRQGFQWGLAPGAMLSFVGGHLPLHLRMPGDAEAIRRGAHLAGEPRRPVDGTGFVSLTGTAHREDEPAHITLVDPDRCEQCGTAYAAACTHFCPGEVYRWSDGRLVLSPSNCLHCMTCTVKCPEGNIRWTVPEGGEGPRYRLV
jgi:electron-transferring-flavoprotein dehydrogenase